MDIAIKYLGDWGHMHLTTYKCNSVSWSQKISRTIQVKNKMIRRYIISTQVGAISQCSKTCIFLNGLNLRNYLFAKVWASGRNCLRSNNLLLIGWTVSRYSHTLIKLVHSHLYWKSTKIFLSYILMLSMV